MRSSKKVPGTTIKSRVLELLENGEILTATEAAHRTGSHWSTTSSLLYRLVQQGVCGRIADHGPLKGYGYFLWKHRDEFVCRNGGPHRWDTDCSYGPLFCKDCGRGR